MVSEIELYQANVPHGIMKTVYGDWSSTQDDVSATPEANRYIYVNTIGFIADETFSIDSGTIEISGDDISLSVSSFKELLGLADPFTLKTVTIDSSSYVVGEIKLNPPEKMTGTDNSFTISGNELGTTNAIYFTIKYWQDSS